ncbi:MAG: quinate 5-dehydrogenase [Halanaerobiaceae bacterium]
MKKVLSISIGSSKRDHKVHTTILDEEFIIERRGTDGDKEMARQMFVELDGKYDAFGIGGIDLYIYAGNKRYTFLDAKKMINNVKKTPAVDGSGLKNTLERIVITYLDRKLDLDFGNKKVLMVSGTDRFGMAETFVELKADVVFGDLIFALGVPIRIKSLKMLAVVAGLFAPVITKLPIEWIYPTGNRQDDNIISNKFGRYYREADIIAGDFHLIKKYMPPVLRDKIIITNTVTVDNIKDLKERGVSMIVTTTPELNGRSFGTNVIEGVLVALAGKRPDQLNEEDYRKLLNKINFTPRVIDFENKGVYQEGIS